MLDITLPGLEHYSRTQSCPRKKLLDSPLSAKDSVTDKDNDKEKDPVITDISLEFNRLSRPDDNG